MPDLPLVVLKQRNFAAKQASIERRRLNTTYIKAPPQRRAITEQPKNDLQMDLRRSSRYNMDLSSAVASYVPGSLELEDIPSVPVYNRNTGKFRVFSSPPSSRNSWGSDESSGSRKSRGSDSMEYSPVQKPRNTVNHKPHVSFKTFTPDFVPNTYTPESSGSETDILKFYANDSPSGSDSDVNVTLDPQRALESYYKRDYPTQFKAESISSGQRSEVFSSGDARVESSSEPELTPMNSPGKLDVQPDDIHGGFLRNVARRSVSTISTCQTMESGGLEDRYHPYLSLTQAKTVASSDSLWDLPAPAPKLRIVNGMPSVTDSSLLLKEPTSPASSSCEETLDLTNTSSVYSSQSSLQRPPLVNQNIKTPALRKSLPPTPPAKSPTPIVEENPTSRLEQTIVPRSDERLSSSSQERRRNVKSQCSESPKIDFCLDSSNDYDKSRFMIPKEYTPRTQRQSQIPVKPRVVSMPPLPPKPVLKVKLHAPPRHISASAVPPEPEQTKEKLSVRKRFSSHLPFRTNVRIRGQL